jgi:hypothetical protein
VKGIVLCVFSVGLIFNVNLLAGGGCYNAYLTAQVHNLITKNSDSQFQTLVNDNASFTSGVLFKTTYLFEKDKKYKISLISEQIVDISTISILDQEKNILETLSNQTGDERNIIELNFTPKATSKYSIYFKVINYSGQNSCGNYLIFSK